MRKFKLLNKDLIINFNDDGYYVEGGFKIHYLDVASKLGTTLIELTPRKLFAYVSTTFSQLDFFDEELPRIGYMRTPQYDLDFPEMKSND